MHRHCARCRLQLSSGQVNEHSDLAVVEEFDPRSRAELLESMLQGLGDGCILIERDFTVVFANRWISEVFGGSPALAGRRLFDILPDHRMIDFIRGVAKGGHESERCFTILAHAESGMAEKFVSVSMAPVGGTRGADADHFRVIIRDQTEQAETEQIRKDFVANASHELRTPLSIINGYLENLIEGVIDDKAMVLRSLITMQKHGERIARIVEDMLTISKFESAGDSEVSFLRRKSFNCLNCVRDVLERLSPLIEAKKATVKVRISPTDCKVFGDRFYWDQVFFNLIENALKENDTEGLEVGVSLENDASGQILRVWDNGVGIPRKDLPFVFKRFYRVAKHRGQEVKGTGLGLSIVKRAIEAHGGTVSVDSVPGVETSFVIFVPPKAEDVGKEFE